MYGSDGPGGDSGGPGGGSGGPGGGSGGPSWGSETVFGTDVRNRQCSEQCSEPTKLRTRTAGYTSTWFRKKADAIIVKTSPVYKQFPKKMKLEILGAISVYRDENSS